MTIDYQHFQRYESVRLEQFLLYFYQQYMIKCI